MNNFNSLVISVICIFCPLLNSCVIRGQHEKTESEIVTAVRNVTITSKSLRDNPNNIGGNETSVYEPSSYFNPDPKFVADQRPVWMRKPAKAHIFLVAVIASDHGFDQKTWTAFFKGFTNEVGQKIANETCRVDKDAYVKICNDYGYSANLSYNAYLKKVSGFKSLGL